MIARWMGFVLLVALALLIPAFRKAAPIPRSNVEERTRRLRVLQFQSSQATYHWSALAEREKALALSRDATPGRAPIVVFQGFDKGARSPNAEDALSGLWKALGPVDSTIRITLVLYNPAPYSRRFGGYAGTSIRRDERGLACTGIMSGDQRAGGVVWAWKETLAWVISPCLLLAGFGPPGPAVMAWLEGTRFDRAGSSGWLTRPKEFREGDGGSGWNPTVDFFGDDSRSASDLVRHGGLFGDVRLLLMPPYQLGGVALRCLVGEEVACRAGVLDTVASQRAAAGIPRDLTVRAWRLGDAGAGFLDPVPVEQTWTSDLIRDQGREKFRRFWASTLPFDAAFEAAFGISVGAWTAQWGRRQWEGSWYSRYRGVGEVVLGANLSPSWPLLVAAWSALLVSLAGGVAWRRSVA